MRHTLPLLLFCLSLPLAQHLSAQQAPPLTIEQVMADPDWIGPPVERAWWSWDGQQVQYQLKRPGSLVRDTYVQAVTPGSTAARIGDTERNRLDAPDPEIDTQGQRMLFIRNGDVFVRDLRTGALTQLTRTHTTETHARLTHDGGAIWRNGNDWYRAWPQGVVAQATALLTENDPARAPKDDSLRDQQLRTLETLRRDRALREAARQQERAWYQADPSRAPVPAYLGADLTIADSALSPDGRWVVVVTQAKDADEGQSGKMPMYVTESGYEEFQNVRTRVGRNAPVPQSLWLVDVATGTVKPLPLDPLPGIDTDPLAALRKAAGQPALKGHRPVRVENEDDQAIVWRTDSRQVAVQLRAIDNKDRWIATVDLAQARLQPRHRLTDPAWINWDNNAFGWLPDGSLWFLSEQSGYSHLYTLQGEGTPRQRTQGRWEATAPVPSADGHSFFFLCNRSAPTDYEVCRLDLNRDAITEVTALDGVENFALSPDGRRLLISHSSAYTPTQLSVVDAQGGGTPLALTDTRTPAFKAYPWIAPEIVQIPSQHGAGVIWGKYYGPSTLQPGKRYPIVMFVHGAGYLQNVHARYPAYFREQMFHNLLVQRGYIVLDLDYRASKGYGRQWRTAIYRNMGHPELEDYLDGLDWLVKTRQGDRDRAGIYGGSYGGFMTFMALFRKPGVFKAGAALRPVVDWTQYNHEYTSAILNTPQVDPQAYRTSSPIEYAAGLQDHLLIAHGMMDDNVFFRDSVVLTQKLIELRKDHWELASYPLERHGFVRADSWLDEYKRVLNLFERTLRNTPMVPANDSRQ